MRKIVLALAALAAAGLMAPVTSAVAQDRTVVIKKEGDRGLHRGWTRGHHYGWRNHRENKKVVIINKQRRHTTTGVSVKY